MNAQYHPEHDRTSCSDAEIVNAEAGGSHGCARCTALLLDQRDAFRKALEEIEKICTEDRSALRKRMGTRVGNCLAAARDALYGAKR